MIGKLFSGKSSSGSFPFVPLAIAGAIIFIIVKFGGAFGSLFEKLGLKDTKGDKDVEKAIEAVDLKSAWHPAYWKTVNGGAKPMFYADADKIVNTIWNAFGAFNDDEEVAMGAIKQLKTKAQVSFVVDRFYQLKKADLLPWLKGGNYPQDRLSGSELSVITNYVNRLK